VVQTVLNTGLLLSLGLLPSLDCSTSGLAFLLLGLEACGESGRGGSCLLCGRCSRVLRERYRVIVCCAGTVGPRIGAGVAGCWPCGGCGRWVGRSGRVLWSSCVRQSRRLWS